MSKLIVELFVIFPLYCKLTDAIILKDNAFLARQVAQKLTQCFSGENEIFECFEIKIYEILDQAIANNDTWQLSDFLAIEKTNNNPMLNLTKPHFERNLPGDSLAWKILQLAQGRSLRLQLPTLAVSKLLQKRSTESALDDFNELVGEVKAKAADATGEQQQHQQEQQQQQLEKEEGRKKKHKDKSMVAMLGGMTMLALVAQMFLSKVILIAGAAFIMAKVALLISALGSLKSGVGGKDHVVVTEGGGGHSHEHIINWRRRAPHEHNNFVAADADDYKFTEANKL